MEIARKPARGRATARFGTLVALVAFANLTLYDRQLGANAAVGVLAATFALLGSRLRTRLDGRIRALVLALVGLAASLALEPGPIALTLSFAGLATLALWLRTGSDGELTAWIGRMLAFPSAVTRGIVRDVRVIRRSQAPFTFGAVRGVLGDWLAPVGFASVFVGLFVLANPILARVLTRVLERLDSWLAFGRLPPLEWLVWHGCAAALVWGWLRGRTAGVCPGARDDELGFARDVARTQTIVRCLVLFNAVFLLQTLCDVAVLGGGGGLPRGMSYAEYAHRGAYPLIATALLAGLFVTVTFSSGQKAAELTLARRLVFAWIAQNLLLLASTVYRLSLYVEAYGLTRWRTATIVWMGLVAIGFLLIAWRIREGRTNGWLLRANAAALAAVLYASSFVAWDERIAWYNVTHCAERGGSGPALDVAYLLQLGPSALAPITALDSDPVAARRFGREASAVHVSRLIQRTALDLAQSDWRTWTVRGWLRARP